jgi:hypothetical protein
MRHTGCTLMGSRIRGRALSLDVGAVHCSSTKQSIVSKSSMEAEMVGLSNAANQGLQMRNFLVLQCRR